MHETHGYSVSNANSEMNPHEGHIAEPAASGHLPGTEPIEYDPASSAPVPESASVKRSALPWDIRAKIAVVFSFVILVTVLIMNRDRLKGKRPASTVPLAVIGGRHAEPSVKKPEPDKDQASATPKLEKPTVEKATSPENTTTEEAKKREEALLAEKEKEKAAPPAPASSPIGDPPVSSTILPASSEGNEVPKDPPVVSRTPPNDPPKDTPAPNPAPPPEIPETEAKPPAPPVDSPPPTAETTATPPAAPVALKPEPSAPDPAKDAPKVEPKPEPKAAEVSVATPPAAPASMPPLSTPPPTPEVAAPGTVAKPESFSSPGFPIPNAGSRRTTEPGAVAEVATANAGTQASATDRKSVVSGEIDDSTIHIVRRNENFWTISRYYYGSGRFYKALWFANKDEVKAPEDLYVGTTLRIPEVGDLNRSMIEAPRTAGANVRASNDATRPRSSARDAKTERASAGTSEISMLPVGDATTESKGKSSAREIPKAKRLPDPVYRTYVVRGRHETLRSIAREELGSSDREDEILELNRDNLEEDPKLLRVGTALKLPEDSRRR